MAGDQIAMLLGRNTGPRQSGAVAPHGPETPVMVCQVGVLMNASPSVAADVADHGVPACDVGQSFVIDLMRVVRKPVSGKHPRRYGRGG